MKLAVVGSGISGLFTSYLLDRGNEVTLYESRDRLGGHSNTVDVTLHGRTEPVDTGFIVFNEPNYPNFGHFLDRLGVQSKPTTMSFSFRDETGDLEYGGHGISEFFSQRRNLFSLSHWRMLLDVLRFYFVAPERKSEANLDYTLGEFLDENHFSEEFTEDHLIPMVSAIWSVPLETAREFPFSYVVDFFENHGLLKLRNRPQWRTIDGGSRRYIEAFREQFGGTVRTGDPVGVIKRAGGEVTVRSEGGTDAYDAVVLATHSDQALSLLDDPSPDERDVLGSIDYEENDVILHTDRSVLPEDESIWAAWNYHRGADSDRVTTVTYNLSILQDLPFERPVCVSLNADDQIDDRHVIDRFEYSHPVYDQSALKAQRRKDTINGTDGVYYAGAYWGDGFHEDGVESTFDTLEALGEQWSP